MPDEILQTPLRIELVDHVDEVPPLPSTRARGRHLDKSDCPP